MEIIRANNETFRGYEEVLGNNSKTWATLLFELKGKVDINKLTVHSKLKLGSQILTTRYYDINTIQFFDISAATTQLVSTCVTLSSTSSSNLILLWYCKTTGNSIENISSRVPGNNYSIKLYY